MEIKIGKYDNIEMFTDGETKYQYDNMIWGGYD